jgi:hypothetical protein
VENYFNYFTEIEEHFQRRFGATLLLSPMDWALIELWKDAGIPLEAVLRGIDATFEHFERRPSKIKKVNALGFCAQEVLTAAEEMKEASVGAGQPQPERPRGFQVDEIVAFLKRNAEQIDTAKLTGEAGISGQPVARQTSAMLRRTAAELEENTSSPRLEDLERKLTVAEEKLFAVLLGSTPDDEIVAVRAQADRELTPYRSKMPAAQIDQLQRQYVHKRLLEKYGLPRLSLFYM